MDLAQKNKNIRKELERLTKESRVLSSIYTILSTYLTKDNTKQLQLEVKLFAKSKFTKSDMKQYYQNNVDRIILNALEYEILDIIREGNS